VSGGDSADENVVWQSQDVKEEVRDCLLFTQRCVYYSFNVS